MDYYLADRSYLFLQISSNILVIIIIIVMVISKCYFSREHTALPLQKTV